MTGHRAPYEPHDPPTRPISISALVLLVSIGLSVLVVGGLLWLFGHDQPTPTVLVPTPPAEAVPQQHIEGLRTQENAVLHSYGWVDKEKGVARIPIDRAMDWVIEKGFTIGEEPK